MVGAGGTAAPINGKCEIDRNSGEDGERGLVTKDSAGTIGKVSWSPEYYV